MTYWGNLFSLMMTGRAWFMVSDSINSAHIAAEVENVFVQSVAAQSNLSIDYISALASII